MNSPYTMIFREYLEVSKSLPDQEGTIMDRYYSWLLNKGVSEDRALSEVATMTEIIAHLMD